MAVIQMKWKLKTLNNILINYFSNIFRGVNGFLRMCLKKKNLHNYIESTKFNISFLAFLICFTVHNKDRTVSCCTNDYVQITGFDIIIFFGIIFQYFYLNVSRIMRKHLISAKGEQYFLIGILLIIIIAEQFQFQWFNHSVIDIYVQFSMDGVN